MGFRHYIPCLLAGHIGDLRNHRFVVRVISICTLWIVCFKNLWTLTDHNYVKRQPFSGQKNIDVKAVLRYEVTNIPDGFVTYLWEFVALVYY